MTPFRNRRGSSNSASWRWGNAWRLLALLAAWQGPLPWCHCHGGPAAPGTEEALYLGAHLAAYHAASGATGAIGWHWHVEWPGGATQDEQAACGERPAAIVSGVTEGGEIRGWQDAEPRDAVSVVAGAASSEAISASALEDGRLFGFAPGFDSPVPARFGVLRI